MGGRSPGTHTFSALVRNAIAEVEEPNRMARARKLAGRLAYLAELMPTRKMRRSELAAGWADLSSRGAN